MTNLQIPNIPDEEKTPVILQLIEINKNALEYMNNQGLAKSTSRGDRPVALTNHSKKLFADITEWETLMAELQIVNHRHIKIATEGALIGSVLHSGLPKSLTIVSDDAGQFNVFNHVLCWIHAEHFLNKLIAPIDAKRQILEDVKGQIWDFYKELKEYKVSPDQAKRIQLGGFFLPNSKRMVSATIICGKKKSLTTKTFLV